MEKALPNSGVFYLHIPATVKFALQRCSIPKTALESEQKAVNSRSPIVEVSEMKNTSEYQIVLEKGEALRPFYELTERERQEIGLKVFQYVSKLAAQFGSQPVTRQTLKRHEKIVSSIS